MRDLKNKDRLHKKQHLWGKYRINRKYKDRLFRLVFQEKKDLLQLYNAINHINLGHNRELMEKCRKLMEYACFVSKMRAYLPEMSLEDAADRAVAECIAEGILADILKKNQGEVKQMILTEYDEDWHIENEKRDSFAEGMELGQRKGMEIGVQKTKEEAVRIMIAICQEFYLSPGEIKAKIKDKYHMTDVEAEAALEAYESHDNSTT